MAIPGKELYRTYDEYGPIQVFDDGAKRYLAFGGEDEQSCVLINEPHLLQHDYTRAMCLVFLFVKPKQLLLLGLGGGALVSCLQRAFPSMFVHAVELRKAVIKSAFRYFGLERNGKLNVIHDDAKEYLQLQEQRVDVLFSDIYDAEGVDGQQMEADYISDCAENLSENGWLVLNCWREHRGESLLIEALQQFFVDVRSCTTGDGNWIIFAGKKQSPLSDAALDREAKGLTEALGFSLRPHLAKLQPV